MKIRADQRVGLLLAGVIVLTFLGIGATVALPATDPSLKVKDAELSAEARKGMDVFREKGLWTCMTTYERETYADRVRGNAAASTASDVAGRSPVMLGTERVAYGPEDCGVQLSKDEGLAVEAFLNAR